MTIRPIEIQKNEVSILITWKDGHKSSYDFLYLRRKCGCAACIDEWTGEPRLNPESVSSGIHPREIRPVGNYGIRFDWSDGHSTGIYSFDYLRSICPCSGCLPVK